MQPGCTALMSPQSAQEETVRRFFVSLIGQQQFDHWFRGKTELALVDGELVVRAASPFLLKWLQKQFREPLLHATVQVIGPAARLRFDGGPLASSALSLAPVPAAPVSLVPVSLAPVSQSPVSQAPPRPAPGAFPPAPNAPPALIETAVGPAVRSTGAGSLVLATATDAAQRPSRPASRRFADLAEFVAGPCNELALTAVRQVCLRPGEQAGPLFLYGSVGTGKTHLLEGIYGLLRHAHSEMHCLFITSEQFTNYFTQALREKTLPAFRHRFRSVDALLVDDVDFFEGKRAIQEEFLHTYKQLESFGRLIVVSADRHPRQLTKLSDELRTRLLSGMVCRLESADLETRERIVFRKAQALDAEFSPEALRYVAQRFSASVRELEGALNCLLVYQRMTGKRVGITAARQALVDLERDCHRVVRLGDIERVVCRLFGLEADDLRSPSRTRAVTEPRMLAMYLARRHTRSAYSEIGRHFGGRNHATVIAAERKVAGWLREGATVRVASRAWPMREILETLEQQLQAG